MRLKIGKSLSKTGIFISIITCFNILPTECTSVICPAPLRPIVEKFGCEGIKCESSFSASNCSIGTVYEPKLTFCGCCPGCARYVGYSPADTSQNPNEFECDPDFNPLDLKYEECSSLYCPVFKNCKPGLICNKDKKRCELPPAPYPTCQGRCWLQKAVAEAPNSNWGWVPRCTSDGYYEPLQRKGSRNQGDCYCVDECGQRILGRSRWVDGNCEDQKCGCSRHVHKLRGKEGRIATIHCDAIGNYEELQCDTDSSLCYCVDQMSGRVMGNVLPQHLWKDLPCYDPKKFLDYNYLRVCESEWAPGQLLTTEAKVHGLTYTIRELDCDYDGSFKPKFIDKADYQERCVHKHGEQILNYRRQLRGTNDMNCRCARDIVYYASLGLDFSIKCQDQTGNYEPFLHVGDEAQCIDFDGYQYGPVVPAFAACCLQIADGSHTCQDPAAAALCEKTYPPCDTYVFARDN